MQQKIRKIFLSVLPFFAVFIPILLGVQQSAQALERRKLIPVGRTVGVKMDTEGLLVLDTGSVVGADNESHEPSKGLLKAGDRSLQANGEKLPAADGRAAQFPHMGDVLRCQPR